MEGHQTVSPAGERAVNAVGIRFAFDLVSQDFRVHFLYPAGVCVCTQIITEVYKGVNPYE